MTWKTIRQIAFLALAFCSFGIRMTSPTFAEDRPNILFLFADDQRNHTLGCAGHPIGYYLGDRGFAGKWTHYDQSLRVPLIVCDPRASQDLRGQVRSELVLNSDLASTMIDLAGESTPASHTGQSLKPLLQGNAPSDWRTDFLCEFLAVPRSIPKWEGVRGTNWSYARYYVDGPNEKPQEFLYDLQADTDQLANLAERSIADLTDVQQAGWKRLRARTDELVAQNGPSMTAMFGKRASVKRKNDRKKPAPTSKSK